MLNQVRTLLCGGKEVTDKHKINQELERFYKNLFTEKWEFQKEDINAYLSQINIPILTEEQSQTCEGPITESELLNALKSMPNNKSPGNDGLTKEFYENFWKEIEIPLCNTITKSCQNGELSTSQREAVIKLIEKKDKGKKLIKNWRPISLLNVDTKLISKVLAERLKKVLPSLKSKNQTAYVKGRFISEGGRLVSDILDILEIFILVLEIAFLFIIQNENINGLDIFKSAFLYTAYADDTTVFLKDEKSVIELIKTYQNGTVIYQYRLRLHLL